MYIIQDGDPTKLELKEGYHHMIWDDGGPVEPEVWFHGLEEYNIAVEVGTGVAALELDGYYYRYANIEDEYVANTDYTEPLTLGLKRYDPTEASWYPYLDGTEERTTKPTAVPPERKAAGQILLEAGEYHLRALPYDVNGKPGPQVDVTVTIRANAQREPIFDEGLVLETSLFKSILEWQKQLRDDEKATGIASPDLVSKRPYYTNGRISHVTYFKNYVYIVHEKWGVIFRVDKDDRISTFSGLEKFLDVKEGIELNDSTLGEGNYMHSGVRAVAFHSFGDNDKGRVYVAAMEPSPTPEKKVSMKYLQRGPFSPIDEESVLIEFQYLKGKGLPETYRLLFRIEVPVYDHTIRQIGFQDKYLFVLHGDGSVESILVGTAQNNDALGKILRIDPLDGTDDLDALLEPGQYSTEGNPFHNGGTPAVVEPYDPVNPIFGPVPPETYALGFRNAHTLTFTKDGDIIVGEAGRDTFEEVNVVRPGGNYGWSYLEGTWAHTQKRDDETNHMFYSAVKEITECPTCKFRHPVIEVGHAGYEGMKYNAVALAGGHVVENFSPVAVGGSKYFFCDFPFTGNFFYAYLDDILQAETTSLGPISDHNLAQTYHTKFLVDGVLYDSFRDVLGTSYPTQRMDLRIGRDIDGALYISSKEFGNVYRIDNSGP